jgi:hypothetical protein
LIVCIVILAASQDDNTNYQRDRRKRSVMQHPFFNESLVKQRMQDLQREAEMEQVVGSIDATLEMDEKDRTRTMIRIFGLACFGVGLLAGSLLMKAFGLLPIVFTAGCICAFVSLPVLVKSCTSLKAHMWRGTLKHQV